jgi:hypothetical protein
VTVAVAVAVAVAVTVARWQWQWQWQWHAPVDARKQQCHAKGPRHDALAALAKTQGKVGNGLRHLGGGVAVSGSVAVAVWQCGSVAVWQ